MREKAREEEERVKLAKLEKIHKEQIKEMMLHAAQAQRQDYGRAITPMIEGSIGDSTVPYMITPSQLDEHMVSQMTDTINFD